MRQKHGFTFVELLIIIGIIAVLAVPAGFGAFRMLERGRLNEAVTTVEAQLAEARRLAKRLDRDIAFQLSHTGRQWEILVDGSPKDLPGNIAVASGSLSIVLGAPYGTYDGPTIPIRLSTRNNEATITITGILAKTVVD